MTKKTLTGYCDPLSAQPGETVRFMVSCDTPGEVSVDLVRVVCGDDREEGLGIVEEVVAGALQTTFAGRPQTTHCGSFGVVPDVSAWGSPSGLRIDAWVCPTAPGRTRQTILSVWHPDERRGVVLALGPEGTLEVRVDDTLLDSGVVLEARRWAHVDVTFDPAGGVRLEVRRRSVSPGNDMAAGPEGVRWATEIGGASGVLLPSTGPLLLAARAKRLGPEGLAEAQDHFNGKIEAPRVRSLEGELLAAWDFGQEIPTHRIVDIGPHGLHGTLRQLPTRAVTGRTWDGSVHAWTQDPSQYGAIHFHDDDLYDAGWEETFSLTVPDDLPSGIYAARLSHGASEDRITFFVRPKAGQASSGLAFLVPTASYLAYANYRLRLVPNPIFGDGGPNGANDEYLLEHPELGGSLYDRHSDYSGVHFSSRLRPIQNLKSGGNRAWQFPADTNLVAWLHQIGQSYDVITDEDLHRDGAGLLEPYTCVITGTHPEYYSTEMLDAIEGYTSAGGRLMYMGGNGFYWRIAFSDDHPGAIEVRRAEDGTRAWIAEPGEYYHAFTGEYGGLWRRIGRAPNLLVGVGFAAQGFDRSSHYRRAPGADDPRAAFVFRGVGDEILGNFGSIGGGAAGEEIDRFDARLGSPPHALVLASSEGHTQEMLRTKEELLSTIPWFQDPKVRADLVFFECPNGGAVFSTGSIAWCGSLGENGGDNNIARTTANVLERFLDPQPFVEPQSSG